MSQTLASIRLTRADLDEHLREDFQLFLFWVFKELNPGRELNWKWHIRAMCHALMVSIETDGDRLLITIPPRHLKSITVAVAFVAWMMGRDPRLRFLCASYGAELSSELASQFKTVVTSPWFRSAFPAFKIQKTVDGVIKTTLEGGRKAVSVGGVTTGFGADYIIVDDLHKAGDADHPAALAGGVDYFRGSLITRTNDAARVRVIVLGQRLHEDDIAGYCLETTLYRHLNLPAIAQADQLVQLGGGKVRAFRTGELLYLDADTLEKRRLEMGDVRFHAQFLQETTRTESAFIKWHKIQRYAEEKPPRERFRLVAQSWDVAQVDKEGADYTVCTTWGFLDGQWWLLDVLRFRADYAQLKDRVLAHRQIWDADRVVIEDVASGKTLISDLRFQIQTQRDGDHSWLKPYRPKVGKAERWAAQAAKLEEGYAIFPEKADWLEELRREVTAFPGKYDDQVDSLSQFLDWSRLRTGRTLMQEHNGVFDHDDRPRPASGRRR